MTIYGLDFSHYDSVPNGARVVSEGFSFMTHKAGGDKDDAELGAWWSALKPYRDKVLLGAYWVLYPGNPTARAQAFLARLDSQCPGWRDGPFILQLDCEIWNGDTSTKPGLSDVRAACKYLIQRAAKLRPIVYASLGQYGNSLTGLASLGVPLWNARYPTSIADKASIVYGHVGGDFGSGWNAYSGQTPAIWQFSSSATAVGQSTCDVNAFRGTLDELTALLAPGWSDDMPLTDADLDAVQARVDKALHEWTEVNPDASDPAKEASNPTFRIGGGLRMSEQRARLRYEGLLAAVNNDDDTATIVTGVLAGLDPAAIAAAIPEALAAQVADLLAQRLQA